MGALSKQFKTDTKKEIEGVPVVIGENEDGSQPTFFLARMGQSNKSYTKALEVASRPFQRQIQLKTISEANSLKIMRTVFLDTVLKGWSYVEQGDIDGTDNKTHAPFTKENANALFDRMPDLYSELLSQASDAANYLDGVVEESGKN